MKSLKNIRKAFASLLFILLVSQINAEDFNSTDGYMPFFEVNYTNDMNIVYNINIGMEKPVLIELNMGIEEGYDFLYIYGVDSNNKEYLVGVYTGELWLTNISTNLPSGKAKIVFKTNGVGCYNDDGYFGIENYWSPDYSYQSTTAQNNQVVKKDLVVYENSYVLGKLGIGTQIPAEKLDVNGNIQVGTNYKIKLMDFPGHTSWIDMPSVYGKASGIGSGGPGQSPWIAFAGGTNQWFTGAAYGDICYRNLSGKLLFGNSTSAPAMSISSGRVGIGIISPMADLDVYGNSKLSKILHHFSGASNAAYSIIRNDTESNQLEIGTYGSGCTSPVFGVSKAGSSAVLVTPLTTGYALFGTTNATPIIFGTNNTERIRILSDGRVGIGTPAPENKFQINSCFGVREDGVVKWGSSILSGNEILYGYLSWDTDKTIIGSNTNLTFVNNGSERMRISTNGRVSIGTTTLDNTPNVLLTVNGAIHAKEVLVDMNILADYVFSPGYSLMPLNKVEAFVKTNRHLPEIPSAAEVKEKGLSMGEMQNKLLQKIEELTLYVIEQQKQIEQLKKVIRK